MLSEKAKDELEYIWSVNVYGSEEEAHCESGELLVYTDHDTCA